MSDTSKAIGKAMKSRRLASAGYEVTDGTTPRVSDPRYTQKEYAKRLGVAYRVYQYWESGRYEPKRKWDGAIKRVFGVSVEKLAREGA